jgi:hypothetical protein
MLVVSPVWCAVVDRLREATPDRASVQVKWTVTALLYQPAALGWGVGAPLTTGGVRSMLTDTLPVPWLPALSVAVAVLVVP